MVILVVLSFGVAADDGGSGFDFRADRAAAAAGDAGEDDRDGGDGNDEVVEVLACSFLVVLLILVLFLLLFVFFVVVTSALAFVAVPRSVLLSWSLVLLLISRFTTVC